MKKSTSKAQNVNLYTKTPMNKIRYGLKIILCLLFIFPSMIVHAESNENIKILLEVKYEGVNENHRPQRDLNILSVLPDVIHDTTNSELIIESQYVTFESVTYYITDVDGVVISSGELTLIKNIEEFLSISVLPSGTYNIILEIGNEYFQGEFDVNTF